MECTDFCINIIIIIIVVHDIILFFFNKMSMDNQNHHVSLVVEKQMKHFLHFKKDKLNV